MHLLEVSLCSNKDFCIGTILYKKLNIFYKRKMMEGIL